MKEQSTHPAPAGVAAAPWPQIERRRCRRSEVPKAVRIGPAGAIFSSEEVRTTSNVCRDGIYFATSAKHYFAGMPLSISFLSGPADGSDYRAEVLRVDVLPNGRRGIAARVLWQ